MKSAAPQPLAAHSRRAARWLVATAALLALVAVAQGAWHAHRDLQQHATHLAALLDRAPRWQPPATVRLSASDQPTNVCVQVADGPRNACATARAATDVATAQSTRGVVYAYRDTAALLREAALAAAPLLLFAVALAVFGANALRRARVRVSTAIDDLRIAATVLRGGEPPARLPPVDVQEIAELQDLLRAAGVAVAQRGDDARRELADRERVELALQRSEQRLRRIIDAIPQAVFALDASGRLLFANRRVAELYGRTPEQLMADPEPLLREPWLSNARAIVVGSGSEGRVLELHRASIPLDTDLVGTLIVGNDVTAARQIQIQLNQASRMQAIGQLAGGLAHEFNNLLTPISGHAELLKARATGPQIDGSALRAPLDAITSAAARARTLIRQVLSFSRTTEQLLEQKPTAIGAVVEEVGMLMRGSLPSSIELRVQVERGLPQVMADGGQLHQVLVNLATNAAQAIDAARRPPGSTIDGVGRTGGRVAILADSVHADDLARVLPGSTSGSRGGVRIRVLDDGVGIDPGIVTRVFEPFFSTKGGDQGTGLGLAVAKGIVEAHNGCIRVESTLGTGSCFEILLPGLADLPRGNDTRPPENIEPKQARPRRVLLVDDDEAVLLVTGEMLRALGYTTVATDSGEAALTVMAKPEQAASIDLVVTDNSMPGMDGYTLAQQLRVAHPRLPIVMLTGLMDLAPAPRGLIDLQLMKPVGLVELERALGGLLAAQ